MYFFAFFGTSQHVFSMSPISLLTHCLVITPPIKTKPNSGIQMHSLAKTAKQGNIVKIIYCSKLIVSLTSASMFSSVSQTIRPSVELDPKIIQKPDTATKPLLNLNGNWSHHLFSDCPYGPTCWRCQALMGLNIKNSALGILYQFPPGQLETVYFFYFIFF